jgi:hypothetical protein
MMMAERQTNLVHTAVGEMQRTAIDAFRGLGFSFALADRVTHALTWAEVVHGNGLRTIRNNERRIREAIPRAFGYSERNIGLRNLKTLDATGKITLESAPRAFDLADADAKLHGLGLAVVRRTFGATLLGEFVARSMERGLGILILWNPGAKAAENDGCTAILGLPDGRMKTATALPGASGGIAEFAPLLGALAESTSAILAELTRSEPAEMLSDALLVSFTPRDKAQPDSCIAAFDRCTGRSGWRVDDGLMDRWRRAVDHGFSVDPEDWKFLYSLVAQTRVVTSERSQAQAG